MLQTKDYIFASEVLKLLHELFFSFSSIRIENELGMTHPANNAEAEAGKNKEILQESNIHDLGIEINTCKKQLVVLLQRTKRKVTNTIKSLYY